MTKKDLVENIMEKMPVLTRCGCSSRVHVEAMLETFGHVAAAELLGGGEITLPHIGKLKAVVTKARKGRHPRTGVSIEIPAGKRLVVTMFRDFHQAVKG